MMTNPEVELIENLTEKLCRDTVLMNLIGQGFDALTALRMYQTEPEHREAVYKMCKLHVLVIIRDWTALTSGGLMAHIHPN